MEESSSSLSNSNITLLTATIGCILFYLYFFVWSEERNRRAFHARSLKYVNAGNMFYDIITRRRIELKKDELIQREGKLWGFNMLNRYTVLMAEPELIQQVVSKEFTNFTNRRPVAFPDPILSKFLTIAQDDTWKRLRSIITPTFSAGKLKRMKPCIDETVETLIDNFNNALEQNEIVDVKHLVGSFTMDTIIQIAFGTKVNSLVEKDNPVILHAKKLFSTDFSLRNLIGFTTIFLLPKLAKLFGVRVNKVPIDFFHKMALEVIKRKRIEMADKATNCDSKGSNFIELLLEAEVESNEQEVSNGKSNEQQHQHKFITNDEIVAQCVLFFLVGYDTTATTITLTCYHLALYPEAQEKLYQEIVRVIEKLRQESETGETDPVKLVTFETLHRFEYLSAVLNESLRLYSPAIFIERVASRDIRVQSEDGRLGVDLKKDDVVHIPVYSVHRDPSQFPKPKHFDPERFLTNEPTFHKYAFTPFGNGPRSCVAKTLAQFEAKMAILHLIRNFRLSVCSKTKVPLEFYYQSNFMITRDVQLKVDKRI